MSSTTRVLPFDQRQRYEVVAALVQALQRPCRLLDVGGFYLDIDGTPQLPIRDMVPQARSIAIDLEPCPLPGYAVADAGRLPFPDRSFDLVSCLDVLEHVPRERRPAVIAELLRLARRYVVIAVPVADEGAAAREEALQRFIVANLGSEQQQLVEHRTFGLPTHQEVLACLPRETRSFGYGNLDRWDVAMLAKHFLMALPHHSDAFQRLDDRYGELEPRGDRRPPFYRHFYLAAAEPGVSLEPIESVCDNYRQADSAEHPAADTSKVLAMMFEALIRADAWRLAAERAPLQQQLAASQTHIQNLDAVIEGQHTQIRNHEQALEDAHVHIRNLEASIDDLKTQLATREQALANSQTHIRNLEAIIDDLRTQIRNGQQALEDAQVHIRNVEAALAAMQARADTLRNTLTAVEQSKVYRLYRLVNRFTARGPG